MSWTRDSSTYVFDTWGGVSSSQLSVETIIMYWKHDDYSLTFVDLKPQTFYMFWLTYFPSNQVVISSLVILLHFWHFSSDWFWSKCKYSVNMKYLLASSAQCGGVVCLEWRMVSEYMWEGQHKPSQPCKLIRWLTLASLHQSSSRLWKITNKLMRIGNRTSGKLHF